MGAACCCLRGDFTNPDSSIYRSCLCLRCFLQNFLHMHASLFDRGDEQALPLSTNSSATLSSSTSLDNSLADVYRSPPRPLPYDADVRYVQLQQDGLKSRRENGSSNSNSHEETDPLRTMEIEEDTEPLSNKKGWNDFTSDEGSKEANSKASVKVSTNKATPGYAHIYTASEDEDDCPTCLEEYSAENPKIITKCSHHFHLGCIYEWMERSDKCPVCGKVMAFDETT